MVIIWYATQAVGDLHSSGLLELLTGSLSKMEAEMDKAI
jgi:hypothetical protein